MSIVRLKNQKGELLIVNNFAYDLNLSLLHKDGWQRIGEQDMMEDTMPNITTQGSRQTVIQTDLFTPLVNVCCCAMLKYVLHTFPKLP